MPFYYKKISRFIFSTYYSTTEQESLNKNKEKTILKNNFFNLGVVPKCILKNIEFCIFKKGQNVDTVYLNKN